MSLPPPNDTQFIDDDSGLVFPWFTKPFLDELTTWKLDDKRVFEYGIGRSTLWWLKRAKEVIGVETDGQWIDNVADEVKKFRIDYTNWTCWQEKVVPGEVELRSGYVNSIYNHEGQFDIIVIDGSYRDECVAAALTKIKDGGIIICDNWEQDYVWDSIMAGRLLDPWKATIYVQPDHTNHEGRPWRTAYWQIDHKVRASEHIDEGYVEIPHLLNVSDAYHSHRPMLWMALEHIKPGLVVEFGCGYGSTPLLANYCALQKRDFLSYETNELYSDQFKGITTWIDYYNNFYWVKETQEPKIIFIDCAPAEERFCLLQDCADKTTILIVHDTEPEAEYVYHLQDALNSFKYRCDLIIEGFPQTTAVSNTYDFERWKGVTLGKYKFV